MNIIFTGLRGTGKTTIARMLSKNIGLPWIDLDREIEKKAGMKVSEVVSKHGWDHFRDLEYEACQEASLLDHHIIATGGGTLTYERNSSVLVSTGFVIWLQLSVEQMVEVLSASKDRPSLTDATSLREEVEQLRDERSPLYENVADMRYVSSDIWNLRGDVENIARLVQRLCVPVIGEDAEVLRSQMHESYSRGAFLSEIRLDLCGDTDVASLDLTRSIVSPREHKFSTDSLSCYYDLEVNELNNNIVHELKSRGSKLIVSHHDFEKTPDLDSLMEIAENAFGVGADIAKVATTIVDYSDTKRLFALAEKYPKQCIVVGMGPKSEIARSFARVYGSYLTFAALDLDQESAPGQLTLDEHLLHHYPTPDTKLYSIVGRSVSHSLSPLMQNTLFKKHDVNAIYLRTPCDDLEKDFVDLLDLGLSGCAVTAPYKQDIMDLIDHVDPVALEIGAVNTIAVRDGKTYGYNTDWIGIRDTLKPLDIASKKVVVLGYGGASKACLYALKELGVSDITVLRRAESLEDSPESLPYTVDSFEHFGMYDYDIVINGTPVDDPVDLSALKSGKIAFDLRYTPSKFLDRASEKNNRCINGLSMLVYQGLEQFRIWTGVQAEYSEVSHIFDLT